VIHYVAGFLFNAQHSLVVLIRKRRGPKTIVDKLNAVGGKVEPGETPLEAMEREFHEEAGVIVKDWIPFATLNGPGWVVSFFKSKGLMLHAIESKTDELVSIFTVPTLPALTVVPNVRWLIPMAISFERGESALGFSITEHHP